MGEVTKKTFVKLAILNLLKWVPDKQMIQLQYYIKMGRKLNLKNPQRYTEKLQWYKLNYKKKIMAQCADKFLVRKFVEQRGLGYILNDLYGVYNSVDEVDFNKLPKQFVLKSTNGASGIGLLICKDKSQFDVINAKKEMRTWTKWKKHIGGREWVYEVNKPKIIAERYLPPRKNENSVVDYKFFCFNGEPFCMYLMTDRFSKHGVRQSILNMDYEVMPVMREKIDPVIDIPPKPDNFDEMIEVVRKLSSGFPYVRVDLYNVEGRILFGEMTFFPESGYYKFIPDEFDFILGEKFQLPIINAY